MDTLNLHQTDITPAQMSAQRARHHIPGFFYYIATANIHAPTTRSPVFAPTTVYSIADTTSQLGLPTTFRHTSSPSCRPCSQQQLKHSIHFFRSAPSSKSLPDTHSPIHYNTANSVPSQQRIACTFHFPSQSKSVVTMPPFVLSARHTSPTIRGCPTL